MANHTSALKSFQEEILARFRADLDAGSRRFGLRLPTGTGKRVLAAAMTRELASAAEAECGRSPSVVVLTELAAAAWWTESSDILPGDTNVLGVGQAARMAADGDLGQADVVVLDEHWPQSRNNVRRILSALGDPRIVEIIGIEATLHHDVVLELPVSGPRAAP